MDNDSKYIPVVLRVFLGLTLIFWGFEKLTVEKLKSSYTMDYESFMFLDVDTFLLIGGIIQIVLGAGMIAAIYTRVSAGLLALMSIVTIIIPGVIIMRDVPHFAYAFASAGGAIALFIAGGGRYSIDEKLQR